MREIRNKIYEDIKESKRLRELASNDKVPFKKSQEIRKEQDKIYKRIQLLKGIQKELEKRVNNENN